MAAKTGQQTDIGAIERDSREGQDDEPMRGGFFSNAVGSTSFGISALEWEKKRGAARPVWGFWTWRLAAGQTSYLSRWPRGLRMWPPRVGAFSVVVNMLLLLRAIEWLRSRHC
jgi:hypothetical protein